MDRDQGEATEKRNNFLNVAMYVVISFVVSISVVAAYDRYFSTKIAYIDLGAFMDDQRAQYMSQKITADQFNRRVDHIKEAVDKLPRNYVLMIKMPEERRTPGSLIVKNAVTLDLDQ